MDHDVEPESSTVVRSAVENSPSAVLLWRSRSRVFFSCSLSHLPLLRRRWRKVERHVVERGVASVEEKAARGRRIRDVRQRRRRVRWCRSNALGVERWRLRPCVSPVPPDLVASFPSRGHRGRRWLSWTPGPWKCLWSWTPKASVESLL